MTHTFIKDSQFPSDLSQLRQFFRFLDLYAQLHVQHFPDVLEDLRLNMPCIKLIMICLKIGLPPHIPYLSEWHNPEVQARSLLVILGVFTSFVLLGRLLRAHLPLSLCWNFSGTYLQAFFSSYSTVSLHGAFMYSNDFINSQMAYMLKTLTF